MEYSPYWPWKDVVVQEPAIRFIKTGDQEFVQVEVGYETLNPARTDNDLIWGHIGMGTGDQDQRVQYRTATGITRGYTSVEDVHPFWHYVKPVNLGAELEKYVVSQPGIEITCKKAAGGRRKPGWEVFRIQRGETRHIHNSDPTEPATRKRRHSAIDRSPQIVTLPFTTSYEIKIIGVSETGRPLPDEQEHQNGNASTDDTKVKEVDKILHDFSTATPTESGYEYHVGPAHALLRAMLDEKLCPPVEILESAKMEIILSYRITYKDVRDTLPWQHWVKENNIDDKLFAKVTE